MEANELSDKSKFSWKRLLITVGIVIVTAGAIGGSVYYVMNQQAQRDRDSAEKTAQDLQMEIDNLKITETTSTTTTQSDVTANWKTLTSKLFAWSMKYPTTLYTNTDNTESNFTKRGGADVGIDYIGGDTYWANYNSKVANTPDKVPSNGAVMALMVYKETEAMTTPQFVAKQNYQTISKTTTFKAGNIFGTQYTMTGNNGGQTTFPTNVVTIFKKGANFYVINYGSLGKLDDTFLSNYNVMLSTLTIK